MTVAQSRIAALLMLPPLTVAAFFLGEEWNALAALVYANPDAMQVGALASTVVFCGIWCLIWRPTLQRDPRRLAATLALAALIIGQVLVWRPMWHSTGCADDDVLRAAQSLTDLGLWCLGFALTWWGGRRWREIRRTSFTRTSTNTKGAHPMSPGIVRLAVGFALIPLLPGVFFIVGQAMDHFANIGNDETLACAYASGAILAVGIWWLVWRRAVNWTPRRKERTTLLVIMMALAPFTPFIAETNIDWIDSIVMVIPLLALAAWFAGTAYVWRLAPGEIPAAYGGIVPANVDATNNAASHEAQVTVTCGQCEYNLRGLREARCPECGWTTTLDVLVQRSLAACLSTGD